jgi:hypothetical protein
MTVTNALEGVFTLNAFDTSDMIVGIHFYDIEITIGTWVKTYIKGRLPIRQDVSN